MIDADPITDHIDPQTPAIPPASQAPSGSQPAANPTANPTAEPDDKQSDLDVPGGKGLVKDEAAARPDHPRADA